MDQDAGGQAEGCRLDDQAAALEELIHGGSHFEPGSRVLELGCGVGAQTLALARRHPAARITAIDISEASLARAERRLGAAGLRNVEFVRADARDLPFPSSSFDHIFVCFVLEHLPRPDVVAQHLHELISPGGTLTVIEGDHGSSLLHPESQAAHAVIACQVELQRRAGGNACLGRSLQPLLAAAGFGGIRVEPRVAYSDATRPSWAERFTIRTFTAMVAAIREEAIAAGLSDASSFDAGIEGLGRAAAPGGTFSYTFYKATARRAV